jgi:hypothetical protein
MIDRFWQRKNLGCFKYLFRRVSPPWKACPQKKKKNWVRLNALQNFTTCTPTLWSGKVSTPKKMEETAIDSKKIGVGSCSLQKFDIFGVESCALQFFWSVLWVTRDDFAAPVNRCHCWTHTPPWVWTVLECSHKHPTWFTWMQFQVTRNLMACVAWHILDVMWSWSRKSAACNLKLILMWLPSFGYDFVQPLFTDARFQGTKHCLSYK